jgi:hypothetical protein
VLAVGIFASAPSAWATRPRPVPGRIVAADPPPGSGRPVAAGPPQLAAAVTVIRPADSDRVLQEASRRIQSELEATGASSRMLDCPLGASESAACGESSSAARIALGREDGVVTIQVLASLPDGLELRRHVRVLPEAGGEDPSVLAVRAVELLRDIYLDIPRVERRPPPPGPVMRPPPRAESPGPSAGAAGAAAGGVAGRAVLGVAALHGRWGLGTAFGPTVGFGVSFFSRLALVVAVAGPFHAMVGTRSQGWSETWQTLGLAELRYELPVGRISPYATAGLGFFALSTHDPGLVTGIVPAATGSTVAPLLALGVGLLFRLTPWLGITVDAREIATWPVLDVTAGSGGLLGRAGGPSDLVEAGLVLMRP